MLNEDYGMVWSHPTKYGNTLWEKGRQKKQALSFCFRFVSFRLVSFLCSILCCNRLFWIPAVGWICCGVCFGFVVCFFLFSLANLTSMDAQELSHFYTTPVPTACLVDTAIT